MPDDVSLTVEAAEPPSRTVVASFTHPGMAGVAATEYIIDSMGMEQTGFIHTEGLPAIVPFEKGRPYHHTRLYSRPDLDVTVLTSKLPVPLHATNSFGQDLLNWILETDVREVAILLGIDDLTPDEHNTDQIYYVASQDFTDRRLKKTGFFPLTGGFLDGINASLISGAIDTPLRTGVLITPSRTAAIDPDASLRLVEATNDLYQFGVDTARLRSFAEEYRQHYAQLIHRIEQQDRSREWDQAFM